jgi:hypothetical protein
MIKQFIIIDSTDPRFIGNRITVQTEITQYTEIEDMGNFRTTMFDGIRIEMRSEGDEIAGILAE